MSRGMHPIIRSTHCIPKLHYNRNTMLPSRLIGTDSKYGRGHNLYDERKFSHELPVNGTYTYFEQLPRFPSGVFRHTWGECLGQNACKAGVYKNVEYFSFHHMSFYDFHLHLAPYRVQRADSKRKP